MAGVICVEVNNGYPITTWFEKTGKQIAQSFKDQASTQASSATPNQAQDAEIFTKIWEAIQKFWKMIYDFLSSSGGSIVSSIQAIVEWFSDPKKHFEMLQPYLQGFNFAFVEQQAILDLLQNIHQEIPKLIEFLSDTQKREKLVDLFKVDKLQKTQETLRVLLGATNQENAPFKISAGLATNLLNRFIEDPELVSGKLERLSKMVGDISAKSAPQAQSGSTGGAGKNPTLVPYELNKERLDKFLAKRTDSAQDFFEMGMAIEAGINSHLVTPPPIVTPIISIVANLLGRIGNKPS